MKIANGKGETPMYIARRKDSKQIVTMLLTANADPNVTNNDDVAPLSIASHFGYYEIANMLLQSNKVNINHTDPCNENCLFDAVRSDSLKLVKLLLINNVCLNE